VRQGLSLVADEGLSCAGADGGKVEGWVMEGGQRHGSVTLGTLDPAYQLAGAGNFDQSGGAGVLWNNPTTGQAHIWLLGSA
jgi:hypothetical protein